MPPLFSSQSSYLSTFWIFGSVEIGNQTMTGMHTEWDVGPHNSVKPTQYHRIPKMGKALHTRGGGKIVEIVIKL